MPVDFLGIGVQRAGTSWLHTVLSHHPQICVPEKRKEVHYFDRFYSRGDQWYRKYFEHCKGEDEVVVGEVTADYIVDRTAIERIRSDVPNVKLLILLRDPIDRLISQYRRARRNSGIRIPIDEYIADRTDAIKRSRYSEQIRRLRLFFDADQIFIGLYERLAKEPESLVTDICGFLDIDEIGIDDEVLSRKVNSSFDPRLPRIYSAGVSLIKWLHWNGYDALARTIVDSGIGRLFRDESTRSESWRMRESVPDEVVGQLKEDTEQLKRMIDVDLSAWEIVDE